MRNVASLRHRAWRRAAILVLALLLGPMPSARAADMYRIEGVPVDATAESAVAARAAAILEGEREGLRRLLRRLTSPDDHARLPAVDRLPIDAYVHSFEIAQEKVAPTRYLATLNISYVAREVQALLRGTGLPFVARRSEPILIVPLELTASGPVAWLDTSPWRAAWSDGVEQARITTLVLPLGDLADVAAAPPAALEAGDQQALGALTGRYGAIMAVVAAARLERAPETDRLLRIELLARQGDRWNEPLATGVVEVPPEEDEAAALARAVGETVAAVEDAWKRQTLVPPPAVSVLPVAVALADLPAWVQIRKQLAGLPEVRQLQVQALSRAEARVNLAYAGELDQLKAAVERLGLVLAEEGDGWHLRPAGDQAVLPGPSSVSPATR